MMKTKLAVFAVALPLAWAMPAAAYDQLPNRLARLSPADFADKIRITDDPLEPSVVLSTRDGYKRARAIEGAHADDVHLQALVDRASGQATWRVLHKLVYTGNRRDITSVHYQAGGELRRSDLLQVEHWLDDCPAVDAIGSCSQFVQIVFELPESTVRAIAGEYRPGLRTPWRLRFKDAQGRDVTGGLAPAEAAGLVHALDQWRRATS